MCQQPPCGVSVLPTLGPGALTAQPANKVPPDSAPLLPETHTDHWGRETQARPADCRRGSASDPPGAAAARALSWAGLATIGGLLSPLLTHSLFTGPAGARAQQPAPPRGAARVGAWRPHEAPADPTAVGMLAPWGPRLDPGSCHSREKPLKVTCTRTAEAAPLRCTRGRRRRPALGPPPRFRAQPMT